MRTGAIVLTMGILLAAVLPMGDALAERVTATGTRVENDTFGSSKQWGRALTLPEAGTIVRVMDASYGFQILDTDGRVVGDFLIPQQAVGFKLDAGEYTIVPSVCRIHRHHHAEVTVEY